MSTTTPLTDELIALVEAYRDNANAIGNFMSETRFRTILARLRPIQTIESELPYEKARADAAERREKELDERPMDKSEALRKQLETARDLLWKFECRTACPNDAFEWRQADIFNAKGEP